MQGEDIKYRSFVESDGTAAEAPYLIPPSHFKDFPTVGLPGLIWTSASSFLESASTIEVIGYSLPVTDSVPRWLLRFGVLWNRLTGENLLRTYGGCPSDESVGSYLGVADTTNHLNQLRLQALLHDPYLIRDFWDRAALEITVIDPDPQIGEHYRRLVGYNIVHRRLTAGLYLSEEARQSK